MKRLLPEERRKSTLGAVTKVDFPEFGWLDAKARVDTGAKTSVLHCSDMVVVSGAEGDRLQFSLVIGGREKYFVTSDFSEKTIRNSFGAVEKRFVIRTRLVLGGRKLRGAFTLANRNKMTYPVLIGRNFLRGRFVVDVSVSHTAARCESCKPLSRL